MFPNISVSICVLRDTCVFHWTVWLKKILADFACLETSNKIINIFLIFGVRFWMEGGGLDKEYVVRTRENDEKNGS